MNTDLTGRVQVILAQVEQLKVKKIEDETNAKRFAQDMTECEAQLKELGYNSVEEARAAITDLETKLTNECAVIEAQLSTLNI